MNSDQSDNQYTPMSSVGDRLGAISEIVQSTCAILALVLASAFLVFVVIYLIIPSMLPLAYLLAVLIVLTFVLLFIYGIAGGVIQAFTILRMRRSWIRRILAVALVCSQLAVLLLIVLGYFTPSLTGPGTVGFVLLLIGIALWVFGSVAASTERLAHNK